MARDYQPLLNASMELQSYDGYLSTAGKAEQNQAKARFDGARRVFVYELFREGLDKRAIWPSVEADLTRLREDTHYGDATLDHLHSELQRHIRGQMNSHPVVRFVIRWGPPAITIALALGYAYFKYVTLESQ